MIFPFPFIAVEALYRDDISSRRPIKAGSAIAAESPA
jgi:hypothetical protein